jgi:hypothetical protein
MSSRPQPAARTVLLILALVSWVTAWEWGPLAASGDTVRSQRATEPAAVMAPVSSASCRGVGTCAMTLPGVTRGELIFIKF